jgi:diguanylate cyclase (GGDEF)-like protein
VGNKLTWANNELEDLVRQLNVALEASGIGIWQHNLLKKQTRWDEQLQQIYGVNKGLDDVIWLDSVHVDDCAKASAAFEEAIRTKSDYASEFRIVRPDGQVRHLRSRAKFFVDGDDQPCFVGAEWDVTDDVRRNQQLAHEREAAERSRVDAKFAADHDYLTGLLNRRAFDAVLDDIPSTSFVSFCHLDIDRFKDINDRFGHGGGDKVLRHVAELLRAAADGPGEIVARLGGDEFVVVSSSSSADRIKAVVARFRDALRQPMIVAQVPFVVECSIGFASGRPQQAKSLLVESDVALYEAKRLGRDRDEEFSPALSLRLKSEKLFIRKLKAAVLAGEFIPYYQVQVDASSHAISGLEALARWESADGLRSPDYFMQVAVATGLMEAIDDAILRRVLFDIKQWSLHGVSVPRVSVNLSAARLADPLLPQKLENLDIPEDSLAFELVETIFLDHLSDQLMTNIRYIRARGITIEIDDLGSGHASLLGLVQLRPDRVKLDRHLIFPLSENETQRRLVKSLIDIATTLNAGVVAEGVETLEHALILADLGAQVLQGYVFGRPVPAAVAMQLLTRPETACAPSGQNSLTAACG